MEEARGGRLEGAYIPVRAHIVPLVGKRKDPPRNAILVGCGLGWIRAWGFFFQTTVPPGLDVTTTYFTPILPSEVKLSGETSIIMNK